MAHPQSAIVQEAGPFALYTQIKIISQPQKVLKQLQALPDLVKELNASQQGVQLVTSIAFGRDFWAQTNQAMPDELISFKQLGQEGIVAPATDVDVLIATLIVMTCIFICCVN